MIDLHTHSTASDGTFTPEQIISIAAEKKLKAIALTDHDTVEGIPSFMNAAAKHDIEAIPGVEISSNWYNSSLHIVGLFINHQCPILNSFLTSLINERNNRNEKILELLATQGINISMQEWQNEAANGVLGRPHLASILVKKGYFQDIKTAFDKLLGNNRPGFCNRIQPSVAEAIKVIHKANGIAIWAHPCAMRSVPYSTLKKVGTNLKSFGIDGLETHYAHFTDQEKINAELFAQRYNLLQSGGSDFHGENTPGIEIGVGLGNLAIPYDFVEKMKKKLNR